MVDLPYNLRSMLGGLIISDGWLEINKSGNTRFFFKQSIDKSEFVLFVFTKFSHFCSSYPTITTARINNREFKGLCFHTRSYPCLTQFYNIFYVNRKKIVPLDLYEFINYEFLAYWIMGDGSKSGNAIILQTQSFTVKECVFIINNLIHKLGLKCSLYMQRGLPTIYISSKSVAKLKPNILPHFPNSMKYNFNM